MTTGHPEPAPDAALVTMIRNLHDALQSARPYVYTAGAAGRAEGHPWRVETADEVLAGVDGALADAGEYLAGVTS